MELQEILFFPLSCRDEQGQTGRNCSAMLNPYTVGVYTPYVTAWAVVVTAD